jgi:CysZ protein
VRSWPGELLAGVLYPFRALGTLRRHRSLWKYVLVPLLINLVVGIVLYTWLLLTGFQWIDATLAGMPRWVEVIEVILQALLVVALLIISGFVTLQFGVILGAPWYGQLAEKLEQIYSGRNLEQPLTPLNIARDVGHALGFEVKKLLLLLVIGLPLLLLNFVPPVGSVISTVGGITLGATIVCLDCLDPSLSRRRLRFRKKLGIIRRNLPASGSFALVCFGLVSIPLLNLLTIPLCITAGALFFCERVWADLRAAGSW